jgi:hypothetical protein
MAAHVTTFEPDADNVRRARQIIRDAVAEAGGDADTAELLTAELAANAVIHARSAFELRWRPVPGGIRVEIVNDQPEMIVQLVEATDSHGRGLAIVDRLARAWGVETGPDSKVVWFELPTTAGSS